MPGTISGGKRAAEKIKAKYGSDYYAKMGQRGGKAHHSKPRGFASEAVGKDGLTGIERARAAGAKGGARSRRGPARITTAVKQPEEKERKHIWPFGKRNAK